MILNFNRSVLYVRAWCEKEADSGTGMENNSCLFGESQNLFDRSRVYLGNHKFIWQIYVVNHWDFFGKSQIYLANHGCIWRITGLFGKSQIYLTNHGFIIWWITGLFDESRVCLKLNNSCTHSSVARFEVYLSTENQSWKCCWKQEEDGSGKILWSLLGCFL